MPDMSKSRLVIAAVGIPVAIVALILIVLLPMSFSYLDYDEVTYLKFLT